MPYGLSFELTLDTAAESAQVTSLSHRLAVSPLSSNGTRITLEGGTVEMNRDLVVEVRLPKDPAPAAFTVPDPTAAKDEPAAIALLTFIPELEAPLPGAEAPRDVLFILDCSGSMQGRSIAEAKRALSLCLRTLSLGDRFSLVRFGSSFEFMSESSLVYSEDTLKQALAHIGRIGADLGGTELHPVLDAAFAQPADAGTVRDIILLTDGQVSNEAALIELAQRHAAANRFFTFGIGSASSQYVVRGLARATQGAAEFVASGERMEEKVLGMFSRIGQPSATDVRLGWGRGCRAEQAPAELPPLFTGEPFQVLARIEGPLPQSVTLACTVGGENRSWKVALRSLDAGDSGAGIAALWARERIRGLTGNTESFEALPAARIKPQQRRDRKAVVELSTRYGVLSAFTSFITVEHRSLAERNAGRPQLRRIEREDGAPGTGPCYMCPYQARGPKASVSYYGGWG